MGNVVKKDGGFVRYLLLTLLLSMTTYAEMSENPEEWRVVTDRVMGGSSNLQADYDEGTFKIMGNVVKKRWWFCENFT